MDFTIKERKFSFTAEYDFTAGGVSYSARKAFFSFNDHLEITSDTGQVAATVQGSFSPIRSKHDFTFGDGRMYHFECAQLWKRVFTCTGQGESYTLYEHKGLRCSVFRDERQIAAFTKNRIVYGKGNQYAVLMDSDADPLLVACMVLSISMAEDNSEDQNTVTFNVGNLGPEARPFDASWQPR